MRKVLLAMTALGLVLSTAALAKAPAAMNQTVAPAQTMDNWFVGVEGGIAFVSGPQQLGANWPSLLRTGYDLSAHVGYDFLNSFKAEFDYLYLSNSQKGDASSSLSQSVFLVTGTYSFYMDGIDPYVGVGVGYAHPSETKITFLNSVSGNFAYQVVGGIEYEIDPSVGLFLNYHYVAAAGKIEGNMIYPYYSLFNAGLNYYF